MGKVIQGDFGQKESFGYWVEGDNKIVGVNHPEGDITIGQDQSGAFISIGDDAFYFESRAELAQFIHAAGVFLDCDRRYELQETLVSMNYDD